MVTVKIELPKLEIVQKFLDKITSSNTGQQIDLLFADKLKFQREINAAKATLKAQKLSEQLGITIKPIPTKILVPLLENASLEDEDELQDKWANMIVNMADSEKNLQNQIFPYLLGQISLQEYNELKVLCKKEIAFGERENNIAQIQDKREKRIETNRVKIAKLDGHQLSLQEFEKANLVRLGLVRQLPPRFYIEEFEIETNDDGNFNSMQPDIEMDIDDYGFKLSELGERFLELCEIQ